MNSAVAAGSTTPNATVTRFLAGEIPPNDLPFSIWQVWSDGFRAGCERMQPRVDRANADADHWYTEARYSPAELREMRLKAMDDGWRAYWDAGMPSEVSA
ncbi:hypothetical protein [Microbacterium sp. zg-YB36]|uniref:hypothetical protein n=1 Tax=Microbacterium sp. zg-YB36 TaxID=2969407 RepID=UPI00214C542B|nr:hypothetical protein [Microbacterium sp. zg-YB36]MDL5350556.1 hypothetical protein [Microbacterium sp. zg-YB36]